MIPVTVEHPAMMPITKADAPRLSLNSGNTGFFDIVELKMANMPVPHNRMKGENILFIIPHLSTITLTIPPSESALKTEASLPMSTISCLSH